MYDLDIGLVLVLVLLFVLVCERGNTNSVSLALVFGLHSSVYGMIHGWHSFCMWLRLVLMVYDRRILLVYVLFPSRRIVRYQ